MALEYWRHVDGASHLEIIDDTIFSHVVAKKSDGHATFMLTKTIPDEPWSLVVLVDCIAADAKMGNKFASAVVNAAGHELKEKILSKRPSVGQVLLEYGVFHMVTKSHDSEKTQWDDFALALMSFEKAVTTYPYLLIAVSKKCFIEEGLLWDAVLAGLLISTRNWPGKLMIFQ